VSRQDLDQLGALSEKLADAVAVGGCRHDYFFATNPRASRSPQR
jgi:hypothetical protein